MALLARVALLVALFGAVCVVEAAEPYKCMACVHYLSMLVRNQYIRQGLHKDYLHFIVDSQLQQAAQRRQLAAGLNYATQQYMQTNPYMMMLEKEEADTSPNPMSMAGRRRLLMRMRASEPPAPPPAKDAPAKEKVSAIKLNAEEEKQKAVGYEVMDTFVAYSSYIYDWIDMGCDRVSMHGALKQRVRPCPAHVACAWIDSTKDQLPFCPDDPNYVYNTIY